MNKYEDALKKRVCSYCYFWRCDLWCKRFNKSTDKELEECSIRDGKPYFVYAEDIEKAAWDMAMAQSGKNKND
jgi:hypothetical protein